MLDGRLQCVAALVRDGRRVADIGTDHAHLPVWLVQSGKCPSAIACDLRAGPLENARLSVREAGLEAAIDCRLGNGLSPVRAEEADDIVIAGMGGETIAAILAACPWIRDGRYRLLLQPMTRPEELRRYLLTNGWRLCRETVTEDRRHLYTVMVAQYTGAPPVTEEAAYYCGALAGPDGMCYRKRQAARLRKRLEALQAAGGQAETCERLRQVIDRLEEDAL